MTATADLFFDNILIGAEEAPQGVLEAQRFASTYDAVLKKRLGHITANDFIKYARRFAALCNEIYQDSVLELRKNKSVPLGFAVFAASQGLYEGNPGEAIDIDRLTADSFREMFEHLSSMVLDIRPIVEHDGIRFSFSQIQWTRGRPRTIFLYSQDSGRYDQAGEYHRGPLHDLLLRKMFHVPSTAPSLNFAVKLGVSALLDEAQEKLS
jgi:hypothetical protein